MKMQYLLWNKESVSNELILKHVKDFGCSDVSILENLKLNDSFEMRSKDEFARKKNKKSAKKQYHSNQANAKMNQKVRHKK
jgi:Uri superfamily endonuclease